ncbi:Protein argonaute 1A [Capsicum baccatum]|uniref:Protein argonaute 1A n=1 Tax=Capsicum baccatum TaxID=33114 RepID=A0A2G2VAZ6_CAPBA|nr:Protein argonaute 1A [Capsicum baccatum]
MSERGRGRGYRGGASGGGRGGGGRTPPSSGGRGGRAPSPSGGRAGGSGGGWPSAPGGRGRGGGGYSGGGSGYSGGGGGGGYTGPSAPRPPPGSSKAIRVPRRPGFGSSGWKCVVRANHFLVQVADRDLHHYDVTITPEVLSKKVCRNIINQLDADYKISHLGNLRLAYDGRKSAYTAGPLPFASKEFVVKLIDDDGGASRERQFKVSIKFAAKADIHHLKEFLQSRQSDAPHETIQALDVVLRSKPSVDYVVAGRSFFDKSFGFGRLPEGLEYWKGYYQSLRPTQMGLSLNIDMSARAFYEPLYVIDFIRQYLNLRDPHRGLADQDRAKVRKVLKGVKVEANHQGVRRYKITGLSNQPVRDITFSVDGTERTTSIVNYFREKYNIVIQYPLLPALQAALQNCERTKVYKSVKWQAGRRDAKGNVSKTRREGKRHYAGKCTSDLLDMRLIVAANNYNHDPMVEDFGLGVRNELTTINARIKYHGSGQHSTVDPGVGHWNMIDKKMINGGRVDTWACVSFSPQVDPASFSQLVIDMCRNKGMAFSANPLVPFRQAHSRLVEKTLGDIHRESTTELARGGHPVNYLQLLIIVVPDVPGQYGTIKRVCETDLGIVSQCCQPKNACRPNRQYLENLALKINVKVGGRNSVLDLAVRRRIPYLTDIPTIVFGADVTHPQPGEDSSPSIAAVVASMDWPEITTYRGIVSAQPHRKEIIMDLYTEKEDPQKGIVRGGMIMELLKEFKKSTGHKPGRIIFYRSVFVSVGLVRFSIPFLHTSQSISLLNDRDGVSEGQFNQVLLDEMDAIRKACTSLQEDYLPRVTFVVVQKRHHTRLFPAMHNDRQTTDKSGNILPGTVVDTHICHPTEFDFYLCSHAGIKGTSRPAHYHVLFDENNFTADAIQNVTNYLCYTYARCTRSVSLVPPAYYAHLAAFRARYYIEDDADLRSTTDGGGTRGQRATEVRPLPEIHRNVKNVMFYC